MAACKQSNFYDYFKENMEALGLPAPVSLFATQTTASGVISSILTAISRLSKNATVAELVGATTGLEKLMVVGAASASFYVGAAIGSFAIATGRYAACGVSISDVMWEIHHNGIRIPSWLTLHLSRFPVIIDKRMPMRASYAALARQ